MAKWIEFVEVPAPGATKRWEVIAKQGGTAIGRGIEAVRKSDYAHAVYQEGGGYDCVCGFNGSDRPGETPSPGSYRAACARMHAHRDAAAARAFEEAT